MRCVCACVCELCACVCVREVCVCVTSMYSGGGIKP